MGGQERSPVHEVIISLPKHPKRPVSGTGSDYGSWSWSQKCPFSPKPEEAGINLVLTGPRPSPIPERFIREKREWVSRTVLLN